jgi:hypothetical protein
MKPERTTLPSKDCELATPLMSKWT